MLILTLDRDDYVMIGDTRVRYVRNKGANSFAIEITTPEGVTITRDNQYAALLTDHANEGDPRAALLLEQYRTAKQHRAQLTAIRKQRALQSSLEPN